MKQIDLKVSLEADIIITEFSATEGGLRCLDHLPGSVFLGAAARRVYDALSPEEAFTAFHSGKVRFLCADPTTADGRTTVPIPKSYAVDRSAPVDGEDRETLHNLSVKGDVELVKREQIRDGYLTPDGRTRIPPPSRRVATKVSRRKGRTEEDDALFTYEALPRGLTMVGGIQFDDDVSPETVERLVEALTAAPIRIGRSKRSEYGRVIVSAEASGIDRKSGPQTEGIAFLVCLSDLALVTPEGSPTLSPSAENLGLDAACVFLPERSALGSRRYSPFNGKRRRPDLERQVIERGSVMAFRLPDGMTAEDLRKKVEGGLGAHRQDGLGQIWMNPPFFLEEGLRPAADSIAHGGHDGAAEPSDELVSWLRRNESEFERREKAFDHSRRLFEKLSPFCRRSGPSPTQWGTVRELSARFRDASELKHRLFDENEGILRKGVRAKVWTAKRGGTCLWQRFHDILDDVPDELLSTTIQIAASRLAKSSRNGGKAGVR